MQFGKLGVLRRPEMVYNILASLGGVESLAISERSVALHVRYCRRDRSKGQTCVCHTVVAPYLLRWRVGAVADAGRKLTPCQVLIVIVRRP